MILALNKIISLKYSYNSYKFNLFQKYNKIIMEILHSASHKLASSSMTNASNKEYQNNVKLFIQNVEQ